MEVSILFPMRRCLFHGLLRRWSRDFLAKTCGALMQTQNIFEIEFQELKFKISVKVKIKERNFFFLYITSWYAIMDVLFHIYDVMWYESGKRQWF
jgi:hypothetical protein